MRLKTNALVGLKDWGAIWGISENRKSFFIIEGITLNMVNLC
jgi:hypothetical protein